MRIAVESARCIAGGALSVEGNLKLENAVGQINHRGCEGGSKRKFYKLCAVRLEAETVTRLEFTGEGIVDLFPISAGFHFPVFGKQFQT